MPAPFSDIALDLPFVHKGGTPAWRQQMRMAHYISDLYGSCLNGYKPPYCRRIIITPAHDKSQHPTRKTGSIISIPAAFDAVAFDGLDKPGKYRLLLDLIQQCTVRLSDEYKWDRTVFEKAYQQVLEKNFVFSLSYPPGLSKNRQLSAFISIEKTELVCSVYANITTPDATVKVKLFNKVNSFWHDCSYVLARHSKWFDNDRFGIHYPKTALDMWYSLNDKIQASFVDGQPAESIDFKKLFWLQLD